MTTVDESKREAGFDESVFLTLVEHTVDVDKTDLLGRRAGHSHQSDPVMILVRSQILPQLVFMSRRNGAKRIFDVVHLEDCEPDCTSAGEIRERLSLSQWNRRRKKPPRHPWNPSQRPLSRKCRDQETVPDED